ncbi:MAG: polysaccharide biosynthesis C-terminal domain-containing protein [Pseudomonadota bacterium]
MSFTGQSFASLAITAFYAIIALAISVLSARLMPLAEYGLYASVMGHVLILTALTSGMPGYLVREVTTADHEGETGVLAGLIRRSVHLILVATILVAVSAWLIWLSGNGDPRWWEGFAIGVGIFTAFGLINALGAILRGLGLPVIGQIPASIVRPVLQLVVLVGITSFVPLNGNLALIILLCASLAALLVASNMLRNVLAGRAQAGPIYRDRVWLIGMATFGLATGFQRINQHLATVTLQQIGTVEQVGLFQPAVEALLVMGLPTLAIMAILMPHLRKAFLDKDQAIQQSLLDRAHRITFFCAVFLAGLFWLLGGAGIAAIFGPAFSAAFPAIAIIALGQVAAAALGNPLAVLIQTDQERTAAKVLIGVAALNLVLLIILIPGLGIEGAAIATSLSIIAGRLVMALHCNRALGLRTWLWPLAHR